jgi:hypothetical protein
MDLVDWSPSLNIFEKSSVLWDKQIFCCVSQFL